MKNLRAVTEEIAAFIRDDNVLRERGKVTVVVEDKADVGFEVAQAIASLGVCVLVSVTGFRRRQNSPIAQGTLELQISCFEHPTINREDGMTLTAQGVSERLAYILHYHRFKSNAGQLLLRDFSRDDVDEANIVRSNYEVEHALCQTWEPGAEFIE